MLCVLLECFWIAAYNTGMHWSEINNNYILIPYDTQLFRKDVCTLLYWQLSYN